MKLGLIGALLLAFSGLVLADEFDPFEEANREIFNFNHAIDETFLKPVASAYHEDTADVVQTGVSNFFGNLRDVSTFANQLLQFKPIESAKTLTRVLINTTFGLGGLIDVAADGGLAVENEEDFGQTLAVWGAPAGPYVVIPLLGPTNLRDSLGAFADGASPANLINQQLAESELAAVSVLKIVDQRASLLAAGDLLNQSDDPYTTMRSAYLQNRHFNVYDGVFPETGDDFADDFDDF